MKNTPGPWGQEWPALQSGSRLVRVQGLPGTPNPEVPSKCPWGAPRLLKRSSAREGHGGGYPEGRP